MPTAKKANTAVDSCAENIAVVGLAKQYVDVEGEHQDSRMFGFMVIWMPGLSVVHLTPSCDGGIRTVKLPKALTNMSRMLIPAVLT